MVNILLTYTRGSVYKAINEDLKFKFDLDQLLILPRHNGKKQRLKFSYSQLELIKSQVNAYKNRQAWQQFPELFNNNHFFFIDKKTLRVKISKIYKFISLSGNFYVIGIEENGTIFMLGSDNQKIQIFNKDLKEVLLKLIN